MPNSIDRKKAKKIFSWSVIDQSMLSLTTFTTLAFGVRNLIPADYSIITGAYLIFFSLNIFCSGLFFSVAAPRLKFAQNPKEFLSEIYTNFLIFSVAIIFPILCILLIYDLIDKEDLLLGAVFIIVTLTGEGFRRILHLLNEPFQAALMNSTILSSRIAGFLIIENFSLSSFLFLLILTSLIPFILFILKAKFPLSFSRRHIGGYFFYSKWNFFAAIPTILTVHAPVMLASSFIGPIAMSVLVSLRSITTFTNVFVGLFDTAIPILHSAGYKLKVESLIFIFYFLTSLIIFKYGDLLLDLLFGSRFSDFRIELLLLWILSGLYMIIRLRLVKLRARFVRKIEFYSFALGAIVMASFFLIFPMNTIAAIVLVMLATYLTILILLYSKKLPR